MWVKGIEVKGLRCKRTPWYTNRLIEQMKPKQIKEYEWNFKAVHNIYRVMNGSERVREET